MTKCPPNSRLARPYSAGSLVIGLAWLTLTGCHGDLDAGRDEAGLLPVEEHRPVILDNDNWSDNWAGENAFLLANSGAMKLVGLIVNASKYWPDLSANLAGWTNLVNTARSVNLKNIPDITVGASATLKVPGDRKIDSTLPLHTEGAQLIVDVSQQLYLPGQPILVVTGSQLTNLADAYLIDPTVVDRVVVVSSLGSHVDPMTVMTGPNGDLDPWADWIVAQRFRYIQIAVRYDQAADVTEADVPNLPANRFGLWMKAKLPKLSTWDTAADQLAVLAVGLPKFVTEVKRSTPDTSGGFNSKPGQGPPLVPSTTGDAWVVTQVEASLARQQLWDMLRNQKIFAP
jgi:hypothetical protein